RGNSEIELYRRPVCDAARSGERAAADLSVETVNLQPVACQRQHAVSILQSGRQSRAREGLVDDLNLSLHVRIGGAAGAVDVKLDLAGAGDVRIEHLDNAEIDLAQCKQRHRGCSGDRNAALQLQVRAG